MQKKSESMQFETEENVHRYQKFLEMIKELELSHLQESFALCNACSIICQKWQLNNVASRTPLLQLSHIMQSFEVLKQKRD